MTGDAGPQGRQVTLHAVDRPGTFEAALVVQKYNLHGNTFKVDKYDPCGSTKWTARARGG